MGFHDTRFPLSIAYGSTGGPGFSTRTSDRLQGPADRVARWSEPAYSWDVQEGIKNRDDMYDLLAFYNARQGIANSFRFFDHLDHTTAANGRDDPTSSDVLIGTGDGTTTDFQLFKTYAEGSQTRVRTILTPIHGETLATPGGSRTFNVLVNVNGSDVAASGNWTVNTTTGVLTFTTAPTATHAIRAGFAFDSPVYFGEDLDRRFHGQHVDFDQMTIGQVLLVEDKQGALHYEEVDYGGSHAHGTVNANFSITAAQGRVHTWTDNTGINCILPDITTLPTSGGRYFTCFNLSGSSTTQIVEDDGVTNVITVPSGSKVDIDVGLDSGGGRVWLAG